MAVLTCKSIRDTALTPETINDYCRKSGDDYISHGNIEENEHGFCVWRTDDESLILVNVYGDGTYWNNWATKKAKSLNMNKIFFATKRNPNAFVRKHGFEVTGYILERTV